MWKFFTWTKLKEKNIMYTLLGTKSNAMKHYNYNKSYLC